jgi:hypothetical protein
MATPPVKPNHPHQSVGTHYTNVHFNLVHAVDEIIEW